MPATGAARKGVNPGADPARQGGCSNGPSARVRGGQGVAYLRDTGPQAASQDAGK